MAGRYERVRQTFDAISPAPCINVLYQVNVQDEEDARPPQHSLGHAAVPNSPPPSFRSRASSRTRRNQVDSDLADAFDSDNDSDDETDDRQRLVRQVAATPATTASGSTSPAPVAPYTPPSAASASATTRGRVVGGGVGTDGVFANMSARPEREAAVEKEEMPPTYEQAAADSAPPYWETTILAPGLGGLDEVYVDGMPVGSVFSFIWNGMISTSFQLVGFLLTYLLHSTHAAKNGSRAGLGITLIQYGFYMKGTADGEPPAMGGGGPDGYAEPQDPNAHDFQPGDVAGGSGSVDFSGGAWMAYALMIVGWFILIKSVADFLQARRHEQLVMQSPDRGLGVPVIAEGESSERVV
ncbi:metal homeostatis protein bsd2 [Cordyceps militaris CM01]|uniref:Metal homeostatis protein bsd2 n=1 Tax=Cordyceps militaris (strain CM01) TaxID=983644 RepID=G3JNF3_CORMM|nr:metal homeostatis protein bsd2 [Cordyceps militaris CM01]EGX89972.1 metal homeostatis protein bsd2 [Cordyceps militaris CM01]